MLHNESQNPRNPETCSKNDKIIDLTSSIYETASENTPQGSFASKNDGVVEVSSWDPPKVSSNPAFPQVSNNKSASTHSSNSSKPVRARSLRSGRFLGETLANKFKSRQGQLPKRNLSIHSPKINTKMPDNGEISHENRQKGANFRQKAVIPADAEIFVISDSDSEKEGKKEDQDSNDYNRRVSTNLNNDYVTEKKANVKIDFASPIEIDLDDEEDRELESRSTTASPTESGNDSSIEIIELSDDNDEPSINSNLNLHPPSAPQPSSYQTNPSSHAPPHSSYQQHSSVSSNQQHIYPNTRTRSPPSLEPYAIKKPKYETPLHQNSPLDFDRKNMTNIALTYLQNNTIQNYNADPSSPGFWHETYPRLTPDQQIDSLALIKLECERINTFQARALKSQRKIKAFLPKLQSSQSYEEMCMIFKQIVALQSICDKYHSCAKWLYTQRNAAFRSQLNYKEELGKVTKALAQTEHEVQSLENNMERLEKQKPGNNNSSKSFLSDRTSQNQPQPALQQQQQSQQQQQQLHYQHQLQQLQQLQYQQHQQQLQYQHHQQQLQYQQLQQQRHFSNQQQSQNFHQPIQQRTGQNLQGQQRSNIKEEISKKFESYVQGYIQDKKDPNLSPTKTLFPPSASGNNSTKWGQNVDVTNNTQEEIENLIQNITPENDTVEIPENVGRINKLQSNLRDHQKLALKWLLEQEESSHNGGILADDMGLGKTLEMISLIVSNPSNNPSCKTTLIITPVAVLNQWAFEIKKHINPKYHLKVYIYHGSSKRLSFEELSRYDVVITSYGKIMNQHKSHFVRKEKKKKEPKNQFYWSRRSREEDEEDDVYEAVGNSTFYQSSSVWYRIILDEAHAIKNRKAITSVACKALKSQYRWCLSGTPMQNSINEFQSLLGFVGIKPFDDYKVFMRSFGVTRQNDNSIDPKTIGKLRALIKSVLLRRTKTTKINGRPILELPSKNIIVSSIEMDDDEREYYRFLEENARNTVTNLMDQNAISTNMSQIFVLLLRLRQASCHLKIVEKAYLEKRMRVAASLIDDKAVEVAKCLNSRVVKRVLEQNLFPCSKCTEVLDPEEMVMAAPCGHVVCQDCLQEVFETDALSNASNDICNCPHTGCDARWLRRNCFGHVVFQWIYLFELGLPQIQYCRNKLLNSPSDHKAQDISDDEDDTKSPVKGDDKDKNLARTEGESVDNADFSDGDKDPKSKKNTRLPPLSLGPNNKYARVGPVLGPPVEFSRLWKKVFPRGWVASTKIQHCLSLIAQIRKEHPGEKILVFSNFLGTLDCVEMGIGFDLPGLRYARYDGSMATDQRLMVVDGFMHGDEYDVLLISIKSGNVGLNLVAANHVVLMDPFWNPFIEDQAMDRAHRFGQTRPVYVHRIYIKNTVEDRILTLQKEKKDLVNAALDEGEISKMSRLDRNELLFLFGVGSRNR